MGMWRSVMNTGVSTLMTLWGPLADDLMNSLSTSLLDKELEQPQKWLALEVAAMKQEPSCGVQ